MPKSVCEELFSETPVQHSIPALSLCGVEVGGGAHPYQAPAEGMSEQEGMLQRVTSAALTLSICPVFLLLFFLAKRAEWM